MSFEILRSSKEHPLLHKLLIVVCLLITGCASQSGHTSSQSHDPLPSWNEGEAKSAILQFVTRVSTTDSPDYIDPAERIAVFDNDGTLWAEQPMYFQLFFAMDRVKALAPSHPEWQHTEPFASILRGDTHSALSGGAESLTKILRATHSGMTTQEFEQTVKDWISTAKHPTTGRLITDMVYQPMLELLAHLRASGFKTYIVSGGGIEFMRPWAEKTYGIPPEQVIGSSGATRLEIRDGVPVLMKLPEIASNDDKEGKVININLHIGRRPVMAFGNSDGDYQMLQWTTSAPGPRFGMIIHHTDEEREWAYDRDSHIGKLDKGLSDAAANGWLVVNMKSDWNRIFIFDTPTSRP